MTEHTKKSNYYTLCKSLLCLCFPSTPRQSYGPFATNPGTLTTEEQDVTGSPSFTRRNSNDAKKQLRMDEQLLLNQSATRRTARDELPTNCTYAKKKNNTAQKLSLMDLLCRKKNRAQKLSLMDLLCRKKTALKEEEEATIYRKKSLHALILVFPREYAGNWLRTTHRYLKPIRTNAQCTTESTPHNGN